jgi:hypothetical protein
MGAIEELQRDCGYCRQPIESKFAVPDRPSRPIRRLAVNMLRQEAGKSRKQKRTIKQLHADLTTLGYDGSYNRVAAFARDWRVARQRELKTCGRGAFVPLAFLPGEAFQLDWSEDWALIGGERTKLQVARFKLSYSRAFILRAYPQQTREMLFDAHNHAFRVLGLTSIRDVPSNGGVEIKAHDDRRARRSVREVVLAVDDVVGADSIEGKRKRKWSYHLWSGPLAPDRSATMN